MATWQGTKGAVGTPKKEIESFFGLTPPKDWLKESRECTWKGIVIDAVSRELTGGNRIAEETYPKVDGGDIEHMGRQLKKFAVVARFGGDDYVAQYKAFIGLLDDPKEGVFYDPTLGPFDCVATGDYSLSEDFETFNYVEIRFTLSEYKSRSFDKPVPVSASQKKATTFRSCVEYAQMIAQETAETLDLIGGTVRAVQDAVQIVNAALVAITDEVTGAVARNTIGLVNGLILQSYAIADDWKSTGDRLRSQFKLVLDRDKNDTAKLQADFEEIQDQLAVGAYAELASAGTTELSAALDLQATADAIFDRTTQEAIDAQNRAIVALFMARSLLVASVRAIADGYEFKTYDEAIAARDSICAQLILADLHELANETHEMLTIVADGLGSLATVASAPSESMTLAAQRIFGDPNRDLELMRANGIVDAQFPGTTALVVVR